jgi:hypothetical protein
LCALWIGNISGKCKKKVKKFRYGRDLVWQCMPIMPGIWKEDAGGWRIRPAQAKLVRP